MEKSWSIDIENATLRNKFWRKVIFTGPHLQIVLMNIPPSQSLGWEKHSDSDQFFRVESGIGALQTGTKAKKTEQKHLLKDGVASVVPVGVWHNIRNTSRTRPLQLYTIYSPPHHADKTSDRTHADEVKREKK
jgi:mannose-6-phosphate isomerase-like protein (cupin superfamily)